MLGKQRHVQHTGPIAIRPHPDLRSSVERSLVRVKSAARRRNLLGVAAQLREFPRRGEQCALAAQRKLNRCSSAPTGCSPQVRCGIVLLLARRSLAIVHSVRKQNPFAAREISRRIQSDASLLRRHPSPINHLKTEYRNLLITLELSYCSLLGKLSERNCFLAASELRARSHLNASMGQRARNANRRSRVDGAISSRERSGDC